jgi:hypothetical protein
MACLDGDEPTEAHKRSAEIVHEIVPFLVGSNRLRRAAAGAAGSSGQGNGATVATMPRAKAPVCSYRNMNTGIRHCRTIAVVVLPMTRFLILEWPYAPITRRSMPSSTT